MSTEQIKSTCSYCGVGCGVVVERAADGRLSLRGDEQHPSNRGLLCSKGMNLHHTVTDQSDRLLYPEMRWSRNAPLQRVDWDTAIGRAAAVFRGIIDEHGPDAVGFYVSGQLLTEEYYLANKLTKGFLGTANIDTNSRLCMSSAVVGYKQALGEDSVPIAYEDIDHCDCFLIAGANPAWCHPILFRRIEARKAERPEAKIIVVDPRRTDSCESADLHLQIAPGTDVTLYNAIARLLIEYGRIDRTFIENHTDGFEELCAAAFARSIDEAANICGVAVTDLELAARWIGEARTFLTLWAMGLNQSAAGVNKNLALINLNLITGQIGRPGSGPFSLTGQPNAMGGREVGGLSSMLAAHRDLGNADHRREVAAYWDVPPENIPAQQGLSAVEMFDALHDGSLKAVWIICTNPLVSLPNSTKVAQAMRRARFVIVQDISRRSDSLEYADLILPAAGWLEKEGTMTNSERRVAYLPKFVEAPGEALPDAEILARFGRAMGFGRAFEYASAAEIYDEHCGLTRGTNLDVSGLSYDRLRAEGSMQWPVLSQNHRGTPRLFADGRFFTDNQRAKLFGCDDALASEPTAPDFPLVLTTGRIRDQWHTMTRSGKVRKLGRHIPRPFLEMHPDDAELRCLGDGDVARITSRRGEIQLRVRLRDSIKRGVVFAPMHWGKILQNTQARANNVTNPLFDPVSKEPDFKFSAVEVTRFEAPRRKIAVIGAGAAAFAFVEAHRRENDRDEIHIFSKEADPFYNRILLPDYIQGSRSFESLRFADEGVPRLQVHTGCAVESVDLAARSLRTEAGVEHDFDVLVFATGSRPRRHARLNSSGVMYLRDRRDADRILQNAGTDALIVGGGLLGVELAGALAATGRRVSLVHRSARLMSRQLDASAGDLLGRAVNERGIELFLNDEVIGVFPAGNAFTAYLSSGKRVSCSSVICALGTEPRIDLATACGLRTNFGIVVDEYLRTSVPDVYAIGECVEFRHQTFGTTLAASDQARVLAGVLAGDPAEFYDGSIDLNVLKLEGFPLVSMGTVVAQDGDDCVVLSDPASGIYKKCIVRNERLVGAILAGDTADLARLRDLLESGVELGDQRGRLLHGGSTAPAVAGELVCSCNQVGTGNIAAAAAEARSADGGIDFEAVVRKTGAGTGCGSCKPEVRRLLQQFEAQAAREISAEAVHR